MFEDKKKTLLLLTWVCIIAVSLVPHRAAALGIEAAVGYWRQDPSGDIQFFGDRLDLENDLGYGTEDKPFGRIKLDLPGPMPNVYLMATPLSFEEETARNLTFNFGGQTFAVDVPFRSKLKLDHYDIALYYSLPFVKKATLGTLNVDLGLDVRIIDFEAAVAQDLAGISASESFILPVPMGYAGFQLTPIKALSLEGEVRGIAFGANRYVDVIGRVKLHVFGPLFIAGGYRYEDFKIAYQDVDTSMQFHGPFVEVGVQF
ncbi:MAG: TIGR04219 family outer membrane beta-barrel protein [Candidatus Methylomirabilales bacterium]